MTVVGFVWGTDDLTDPAVAQALAGVHVDILTTSGTAFTPTAVYRSGDVSVTVGETGEQVLVAANVDDLDPRLWPGVLTALLDAGAVDAWLTPIVMKKGRPAHTVTALCDPDRVAAVGDALVTQTTTIGYRWWPVTKVAAARTEQVVVVRGYRVRVKVTERTATPEWDDVEAAAADSGIPARELLAEAQTQARAFLAAP